MSDRRSFISRLVAGTFAAIALPVLYGVGRFLRPPRTVPAMLTLDANNLPTTPNSPRLYKLGTKDIAIIRTDEGAVDALSLTCTHTGCGVQWRPQQNVFHCPCHDGVFASDGSVISGPPRHPLDRLRVESVDRVTRIFDEAL